MANNEPEPIDVSPTTNPKTTPIPIVNPFSDLSPFPETDLGELIYQKDAKDN